MRHLIYYLQMGYIPIKYVYLFFTNITIHLQADALLSIQDLLWNMSDSIYSGQIVNIREGGVLHKFFWSGILYVLPTGTLNQQITSNSTKRGTHRLQSQKYNKLRHRRRLELILNRMLRAHVSYVSRLISSTLQTNYQQNVFHASATHFLPHFIRFHDFEIEVLQTTLHF